MTSAIATVRRGTRPLALAGSALLLALALGACGDDEPSGGDDPSPSSASSGADDGSGSGAADESPDSAESPTGSADGGADDGADAGGSGTVAGGDFCKKFDELYTVVGSQNSAEPTAKDWKAIQDAYAAWGAADIPDGANKREKEGFKVMFDAIADTTYAELKKTIASGAGSIPGVSKADNAKAEEAAQFAVKTCGAP